MPTDNAHNTSISLLEALTRGEALYRTAYRVKLTVKTTPWHQHPCWEVVYHRGTRGNTEIADGDPIDFREESVVIYPVDLIHNQHTVSEGEDLCVHWQMPATSPPVSRQTLYIPRITSSVLLADIQELLYLPQVTPPLRVRALSCRLTAFLVQLLQEEWHEVSGNTATAPERYVAAARAYLSAHATEIEFLEEAAAHVGISYDHLRHLFRQQTGISMSDYVQHIRIERAKDLLSHTALPVKTVAVLSGFHSTRYFITVFRQQVRCTPNDYRQYILRQPLSASRES